MASLPLCAVPSPKRPRELCCTPVFKARYETSVSRIKNLAGIATTRPEGNAAQATPALFETEASVVLGHHELLDEVFGPASVLVQCTGAAQMEEIARRIPGSLTATVHGTAEDLVSHRNLISILEERVGRLLFGGFPTGMEVCPSMHHGGPWPATSDVRFTSVGTAAIQRFARPLCYQDCPAALLPAELLEDNPKGILRTMDGVLAR